MMATPAQVNAFRVEFDLIDEALRRDVLRIMPSARNMSPSAIRDMFLELGPQLADRYGQAAALAAAEYFEATTGYTARTAALTSHEAVQGSVRYLAGGFWTPARERAFQQIAASLARHSLQAGRSTVAESAARNQITYARAPAPDACDFCVMLSSRGATYGSARSAGEGNQWHDDCRCVIEPVGPNGELSYDADALYEQYVENHYSKQNR
jgi:hypothetical protein